MAIPSNTNYRLKPLRLEGDTPMPRPLWIDPGETDGVDETYHTKPLAVTPEALLDDGMAMGFVNPWVAMQAGTLLMTASDPLASESVRTAETFMTTDLMFAALAGGLEQAKSGRG